MDEENNENFLKLNKKQAKHENIHKNNENN